MQPKRSIHNVKKCELARALLCTALTLCATFAPGIAGAALGEPETSDRSDLEQLHGSAKIAERANFRMHEMQLPSGTLVREFAADGRVFAVTWTGPTIPNLRQILGRYFDNYVAAAGANRLGHHHLQIHQDDFVVQSGGHMRAFSGLAYLPPALPGGLKLEDLH